MTDDKKELIEEHEKLFQALKQADVDWLTEHYVPDVTRFHQKGGLDIGWTADKAAGFKKMFEDGLELVMNDWELSDIRIYGDFAVTAGYVDGGWKLPSGEKHIKKMRISYVWHKIAGRWKELHHHASDLQGNLEF